MSIYNGLDKISTKGLKLIEKYRGKKIYEAEDGHPEVNAGLLVVSSGYLVDEQLRNIEVAHQTIDHFLSK